jgi:hypothetical protein
MPPKSKRASAQHSAGQEESDHSDASEEMSDPELDIDEDEERKRPFLTSVAHVRLHVSVWLS